MKKEVGGENDLNYALSDLLELLRRHSLENVVFFLHVDLEGCGNMVVFKDTFIIVSDG